ncbi:MAG: hypothetical protein JNN15_07475 [Blastocatellia bacterium]|nr:hypothetical protein [Blastocatellia bacterium]
MANQKYRSVWVTALFSAALIACMLFWGFEKPRATTGSTPKIDRDKTILKGGKKREMVIVGENFEPGMFVQLQSHSGGQVGGIMAKGQIEIRDSKTVIIKGLRRADFPDGVATITLRNADGVEVKETLAIIPSAIGPSPLTQDDIRTIIAQGVSMAQQLGFAGTFCITDREGNVLAFYRMTGADKRVAVRDVGALNQGLENAGGPGGFAEGLIPAEAAALSKAGTGSFFGTQGNAFSTRSAAYIIREHLPPFIKNTQSGPLFGVQISSLGCSDVKMPGLPLGISGDPGGLPIYKNGIMAGGLGVELNGLYTVFLNRPQDLGKPLTTSDELFFREGVEEMVAFASVRGFEAPDSITGDKILVNGIRLPYRRPFTLPSVQTIPFDRLPGQLLPLPGETTPRIRTGVPTEFRDIMLRDKPVRVVNRFFPFKNEQTRNGAGLTASDVEQILFQGTTQAYRTRAAIRRPIEVFAEVNLTVVDVEGNVLGIVSTPDAPIFGFDVSVEKARSSTLFSRPDAADILRRAGVGQYVDRVQAEGLKMDGQFALTSRSVGWLHRPFYPDGIEDRQDLGAGPLSTQPRDFSPLNNGFQTDYLLQGRRKGESPLTNIIGRSILNALGLAPKDRNFCDATNGRAFSLLNNTAMVFAGSSPLFKGGRQAGAIGISGDGIDQDDIISAFGSEFFEAPPERRVDRFFFRGIRIPYTKFPRHPNIGEGED